MNNNKQTWKEWCNKCKKYHITILKDCPSCGVHKTPQPVSEKVLENHLMSHYECDGCEAYRDHLA
jgi:hypothetical protein